MQRRVGLAAVPRAALAERVHQRRPGGPPPRRRTGRRRRQRRHVERGQVVRLDGPVELPPVDRRHHLVVEPEVVQDHRPRRARHAPSSDRPSFTSESRWRDQHWATRNGPRSPPPPRRTRRRRRDGRPRPAGSMPRAAQARSRKESAGRTVTSTRSSARSSSTRALGHQRRPGDGVDDRARAPRRPRPPPPAPRRSRRTPRRRSPRTRRGRRRSARPRSAPAAGWRAVRR